MQVTCSVSSVMSAFLVSNVLLGILMHFLYTAPDPERTLAAYQKLLQSEVPIYTCEASSYRKQ